MVLNLFKIIMKTEKKINKSNRYNRESTPSEDRNAKADRRSWCDVWVAFLDWRE